MNFFCDSGGNIFHVDPEKVYQGSANANTIYFIGAFASNLSVTIAYRLPNGLWTTPILMTAVTDSALADIQDAQGQGYSVWTVKITGTITERYGTVDVQFFVYGNNGTTDGGVLATALSSFEVSKGVPITLPSTPTDNYEVLLTDILAALSTAHGEITYIKEDIRQIKTEQATQNTAIATNQALATNQPNIENAGLVGTPSVSIEEVDGLPRFKFEYLKGKDGAKLVSQVLVGQDASGGNIYNQTFDDGTTAIFVAPKGEQGEKGDKGTSVTVSNVSESTASGGTNVVTFSDGKTLGVKNGKDYVLTEADRNQIAAIVLEMLGGEPIFGYVDEDNNIVLSGNLTEGTYTAKYDMGNNTFIEIGQLVFTYSVKSTLTNCTIDNSATSVANGGSYYAVISANSGYELSSVEVTMGGNPVTVTNGVIDIQKVTGDIVIEAVATAVQTNDPNNILTNGDYTVEMNKRWSGSSKSYIACDGMICITIPTADVLNKTIYFKGFTKDLQSSGSKALWMAIDESLTKQSVPRSVDDDGCIWGATYLTDEGNGAYSLAVNSTNFKGYVSSTTYLKLNMAVNASTAVTSLDGLTMTIDKPIS